MYVKIIILSVLLVIERSVQEDGYKSYENYKAYIVKGREEAIQKLGQSVDYFDGIINLEQSNRGSNYLVSQASVQHFEKQAKLKGLDLELIYDDFSKIIKSEKELITRSQKFSWDAYYDYDIIYEYLAAMHEKYPNSTKLIVGGQSYENRTILGLRIMTPYDESQEKPAVFIESGIHAREWITPATSTYFINQLLTSEDPEIINLRQTYDWHIFPTVNPDGYHYTHTVDRMWRKTRSRSSTFCYGADPNRNWDHNWGQHGASKDPCDKQIYAGKTPFSEIETKSLSEYIKNVRNLSAYIALHADAEMLLLPYSDSTEHSDNYDDLVKIGTVSLEYGKKVNGAEYSGPATAAEILYKASGGSMDWVRESLGTPLVFTYELRGYFFTWPANRIPEQGDELTQMILGLILESQKLGYF